MQPAIFHIEQNLHHTLVIPERKFAGRAVKDKTAGRNKAVNECLVQPCHQAVM